MVQTRTSPPRAAKATRSLAGVAVFLVSLLVGCSGGGSDPVLSVLFVDVSASTQDLRQADGPFEQGALDTAIATAEDEGTLWASIADESTVANSLWMIRDQSFSTDLGGMPGEDELKADAEALEPELDSLVQQPNSRGSDLLGALQMSANLFGDNADRPRALVLLTDGGLNIGDVNLTRGPAPSPAEIDRAVQRLKASGQLPDLTGGEGDPVQVWMGGLGHGLRRPTAQAVITFWEEAIPAAGGELVASDSSLRLEEFPPG